MFNDGALQMRLRKSKIIRSHKDEQKKDRKIYNTSFEKCFWQ